MCYFFKQYSNVLILLLDAEAPRTWHACPHVGGEAGVKSDARDLPKTAFLGVITVWIDGMWPEVLAVIIIVVVNVVCYAAHEKSLFHGHLRLPKVFFASNRCNICN